MSMCLIGLKRKCRKVKGRQNKGGAHIEVNPIRNVQLKAKEQKRHQRKQEKKTKSIAD